MPTKIKGCRNCSRRRINCDRTQPQCKKCVRDQLECYGLDGTYRWMPNPVTKRPRRNGRISQGFQQSWPERSSSDKERVANYGKFQPSSPHQLPMGVPMLPHQPEQWVINFFAEQISPWMCPTYKVDNECKQHLLPLALSSPLVFHAVAATTYHRLAYYGNVEFSRKAEHHKTAAIKGLTDSALSAQAPAVASSDMLFDAATLLILMYDEMVAAQDNFTILARLMGNLRRFVDFSQFGGNTELRRYLTEQFGCLTIFCLPHVDSETASDLQTPAFEFIEEFAHSSRVERHNPPFLADCFKTVLTVWLNQKQNLGLDVDRIMTEFKLEIEAREDIAVFDHFLTWVYFMASAASPRASLRKFFSDRLLTHTTTFGWKNVAMMHQFLRELEHAGPRWPSRLQSHKRYICA